MNETKEPAVLWEDRGDGYSCIWQEPDEEVPEGDTKFRLELWVADRGEPSGGGNLGGWDIHLVDAASRPSPDTGVWVPAQACGALLSALQKFAAERPICPPETAASDRTAKPRQSMAGKEQPGEGSP